MADNDQRSLQTIGRNIHRTLRSRRITEAKRNLMGRALLEAIRHDNVEEVARLLLDKHDYIAGKFVAGRIFPNINLHYTDPKELYPNRNDRIDPVTMAVRRGNIEILRILWLFAANRGDRQTIQELLASGINVNIQDPAGNTALAFASENGHLQVVERLLAVPGIDVNLCDDDNYTPLVLASSKNYRNIIDTLLAVPDIDVNVNSLDGTALMIVARNERASLVELLLEHGADVRAGVPNPFEEAQRGKFTALIRKLIKIYNRLPIRNIPRDATNTIMRNDIRDGYMMATWERNLELPEPRYYRFRTFTRLDPRVDPYTRAPIVNPTIYRAHLIGGLHKRRRRTYRKRKN